MAATISQEMSALSQWVDDHSANKAQPSDVQMIMRCLKVAEEAGEVAQALIGMRGQNPRKGVTHTREDVIKELLDVAVTALAAVEHLTGNVGDSEYLLKAHLSYLCDRVGITR